MLAQEIRDGHIYLASSVNPETGERVAGLYRARVENRERYLDAARVVYQTTTMDSGVLEALYEGADMDAAAKAALEYAGRCSIVHFRHDGTVRPVADFKGGQSVRGYIYE